MCTIRRLAGLALSIIITAVNPLWSAVDNSNLAVTQFTAEVTENSQSGVSVRLNLGELQTNPVTIGTERFDRIAVEGATPSLMEGRPDFPAVVRYVLIPPQSGVELEVGKVVMIYRKDLNPLIVQPDDPANPLNPAVSGVTPARDGEPVVDPLFYARSGFQPSEPIILGTPAILRGYRIVPVITYPVRYNPATGETAILETADIRLNFDTDKNRVSLVRDPDRKKPSRYAHKLLESLVVNPPEPSRDDERNGAIAYVLGTGATWDRAAEGLTPLIEWRRRAGWTVELIRVQNIQDRFAVKAALLDAYNNWETAPEHIVLVGDASGAYSVAYWDFGVGAQYIWESDQPFTELEGDDPFPDVTVGRLPIADVNPNLDAIVAKTVAYESAPVPGIGDQVGWQKRGAVFATDMRNGRSSIDLCLWTKRTLLDNGYTDVAEVICSPQDHQPAYIQPLLNSINAGLSIVAFRGHGVSEFRPASVLNTKLNNSWALPFVMLMTCNTADFAQGLYDAISHAERLIWAPNGGAIGSLGTAGSVHTAYNNITVMGAVRALFGKDISVQGWVFQAGRLEMYNNYAAWDENESPENRGDLMWHSNYYITNMFGDPAVDLFTDIPKALVVNHSLTNAGQSKFTVEVFDEAEEMPVAGAQVCLYKPGVFQYVGFTDVDGRVVFYLNPNEVVPNQGIQLTVTGHNLHPKLIDINVEEPELLFGIGQVQPGERQGADGDGWIEPSEPVELVVEVVNYGQIKPEGEMMVTLSPAPGYEELIMIDQQQIIIDDIPVAGENVMAWFDITLSGAMKVHSQAKLDVTIVVGEARWFAGLEFPVQGPALEFVGLEWEGAPVRVGEMGLAWVRIANIGGDNESDPLNARVISFTPGFEVVVDDILFDPIPVGEEAVSNDVVMFSANPLFHSGSTASLGLVINSEQGLTDTIRFSYTMGEAGEGDPILPDNYGYICVDDMDVEWFVHPEFNWIDIREDGVNLNLKDVGEEDDKSVAVDLPFEFQYYGKVYDRITICTNGWAAFGEQAELTFANNRRIPDGSISAMLCPFWDDLVTADSGGIFTRFIEEENIFIIQWLQMQRLTMNGFGETETFEIVLYDPAHHPSLTGDGDIVFQYLNVTEGALPAGLYWDTPFATVGISNEKMNDGILYSYWNTLTPGAAPLEDGRAIKFTTMRAHEAGWIRGVVLSAAEGIPIEGVTVFTNLGNLTVTDEEGRYLLENVIVPAVFGGWCSVTATKQFFNPTVIERVDIVADDTVEVNLELRHPEFNMGAVPIFINDSLRPDGEPDGFTKSFDFRLTNSGVGPLTFSTKYEHPNLPGKPFDLLQSIDVTAQTGNSRIYSTVFIDSLLYVFGGGDEMDGILPKIYRFNKAGELLDSLNQPWLDNYGIRSACWDGKYIWSNYQVVTGEGRQLPYLYALDPKDGSLADSIPTPGGRTVMRCVTYDSENDLFYVTQATGSIYAIKRNGDIHREFDIRWQGQEVISRAIAYYPAQPDSFKFLVVNDLNDNTYQVIGYNPSTLQVEKLAELPKENLQSIWSVDITPSWNREYWVFIGVVSISGERQVDIRMLDLNTSWITATPIKGTLEAGEDTTVTITLNSEGMVMGSYSLSFVFTHDADPGFYKIPVTFIVDTFKVEVYVMPNETVNPVTFSLAQNSPNPFNPSTTISYSVAAPGLVQLTVYDIAGRMVRTLVNDTQPAGTYSILFDGAGLSNGVYIYRLTTGNGRSQTKKMVLIK